MQKKFHLRKSSGLYVKKILLEIIPNELRMMAVKGVVYDSRIRTLFSGLLQQLLFSSQEMASTPSVWIEYNDQMPDNLTYLCIA